MENILRKLKKHSSVILLFIAVVPLIAALLRPGFFPMHDDMQAMRLLQMDKCIKDGQFPCRWVPDMGYGYGYPQFNYYSPFPYYLMELFHLSGFSFLDSVKIFFIVSALVSTLGMYLFGKSLWGSWGGFLSALFYSYAPYRAVNMYVRGAVGELAAFAIIPFLFLFVKQVVDRKKYSVLGLTLAFSALFISHNISVVMVMPFIMFWALYLVGTKKDVNLKAILAKLSLSFLWSILISAFFILPAWLEKEYVHIETILSGYFNYLAHFVGVNQMLFSTNWGYGSSQLGSQDDVLLSVGLVHWIAPLVVLLILLFFKHKLNTTVLFLTVAGWVSLFMMHPKSTVLWNHIDVLAYFQFPWRFLLMTTFLFSACVGAISLINKTKGKTFTLLVTGVVAILAIAANIAFFKPSSWIEITDAEKFSGKSWDLQQTISIYDYLPIYAKKAPDAPAEGMKVVEGQVSVTTVERGTNWSKWDVEVASESAVVYLPIYYFPNWKVFVNNTEAPISFDNELGLITVTLPAGKQLIEARLYDTTLRSVSNLLSLVGIFLIPAYIIKKHE